ncbi:MAG: hypothetical protein LAP85_11745 [Acidobacteriia bacterium]|nr:hypothetical protein [Terriglobia bacterium]
MSMSLAGRAMGCSKKAQKIELLSIRRLEPEEMAKKMDQEAQFSWASGREDFPESYGSNFPNADLIHQKHCCARQLRLSSAGTLIA